MNLPIATVTLWNEAALLVPSEAFNVTIPDVVMHSAENVGNYLFELSNSPAVDDETRDTQWGKRRRSLSVGDSFVAQFPDNRRYIVAVNGMGWIVRQIGKGAPNAQGLRLMFDLRQMKTHAQMMDVLYRWSAGGLGLQDANPIERQEVRM